MIKLVEKLNSPIATCAGLKLLHLKMMINSHDESRRWQTSSTWQMFASPQHVTIPMVMRVAMRIFLSVKTRW